MMTNSNRPVRSMSRSIDRGVCRIGVEVLWTPRSCGASLHLTKEKAHVNILSSHRSLSGQFPNGLKTINGRFPIKKAMCVISNCGMSRPRDDACPVNHRFTFDDLYLLLEMNV